MQKQETGLTKNQILSTLSMSVHGNLAAYVPVCQKAATEEPEFYAHLLSYDRINGQIRDTKAALPVIALLNKKLDPEFESNALAHIASLVPRELVKAVDFSRAIKVSRNKIRSLVELYLHEKESNWAHFERTALQHKASLRALYGRLHIKPSTMADAVLFKGERPRGSLFEAVANLKFQSPVEAAGTIMQRRIPFLIARGALGNKLKDPSLVLALIEGMSSAELINNSKQLEKLGVNTVPALRAAYNEAIEKASKSKKVSALKASVAADAIADESVKAKLRAVQEEQIKNRSIEGNWAVLADKSGSMNHAIEIARHVAATLAKMAGGRVDLVFFDTTPRIVNVTGKTYDEILVATKHIAAGGGTSIGCGLVALLDRNVEVDGIAIVSDGGENTAPLFPKTYEAYSKKFGKEVPVYFYQTTGDTDALTRGMKQINVELQTFDLTHGNVDYFSIPNLAATMRVNRYSLVDTIMESPLLKLEDVLKKAAAEMVA